MDVFYFISNLVFLGIYVAISLWEPLRDKIDGLIDWLKFVFNGIEYGELKLILRLIGFTMTQQRRKGVK